jgi:Flp pilus assembly protein TadG
MAFPARVQQRGQAIVLIVLVIVVMFGLLGLAVDGGRAYLDRRQLQASVDAAALAAAYKYMNTNDYAQSEQAATNQYANNERLYMIPTCSGYGTPLVSCVFGDSTNQVLTLTVVNRSIAGVTFTATGVHQIPVAIMQVLGSRAVAIGATATALARKVGTNGAAIQTLAPSGCGGNAGSSLTFQGNSTTIVTGDVWSNGNVFDNSAAAGGSITGNLVGICPASPFLNTPTPWTVSGAQVDGWTMPDPDYPTPPINATTRSWSSTSGSVEQPGTYTANPQLGGGAGCYFLAGGVYDFSAGFTQNGGFISNELRPPDEPNLTGTTSVVMGTITSIPVSALSAAVPGNSTVTVAGQAFTVTAAGAASGRTSIPVNSQAVSGSIASGTTVVTMARGVHQFWDSNGVGCGSSFSLTALGSTGFASGAYSVEVTAVRWEPTSGSTCSGPATPSCFGRESAPSMCKTVALASSGNIKVAVTSDPGATDFNVYLAPNGSCTGLSYCTDVGNGNSSVTINGCPTGQPSPPDPERPPLVSSLPNTDPPAATPPRGDLANENHCVDPATGNNVACPSAWTPGAVVFLIPGSNGTSPCLDLHGGGDIYLFSGNQYQRVVLFMPGPEQSSQPNTCTTNKVNGNGFTTLIGIFYMPAASVTINGNSAYQATIAGGVIAWTASIIGNGKVAITADPTLRTWPPTVRLTQ